MATPKTYGKIHRNNRSASGFMEHHATTAQHKAGKIPGTKETSFPGMNHQGPVPFKK